jgi:hypothetical protein
MPKCSGRTLLIESKIATPLRLDQLTDTAALPKDAESTSSPSMVGASVGVEPAKGPRSGDTLLDLRENQVHHILRLD